LKQNTMETQHRRLISFLWGGGVGGGGTGELNLRKTNRPQDKNRGRKKQSFNKITQHASDREGDEGERDGGGGIAKAEERSTKRLNSKRTKKQQRSSVKDALIGEQIAGLTSKKKSKKAGTGGKRSRLLVESLLQGSFKRASENFRLLCREGRRQSHRPTCS